MDLSVLQAFLKEALSLGFNPATAAGLGAAVGAQQGGENSRTRSAAGGAAGGAVGHTVARIAGGLQRHRIGRAGAIGVAALGTAAGMVGGARLARKPKAPVQQTGIHKVSSLVLGKEVRPDMDSRPKVKGLQMPRAFTPRLGAKKLPGGTPANPFSGNKVKLQKEGSELRTALGTAGVGVGAGLTAAGLLRSRKAVKHRYDRPNEKSLPPQLELARDVYRELNSRSA